MLCTNWVTICTFHRGQGYCHIWLVWEVVGFCWTINILLILTRFVRIQLSCWLTLWGLTFPFLSFAQKSTNYLFLLAISIIVACHCSAINRGLSYRFAAPLITMIRIFYSGATAWLILASTSEYGVPAAKFLNHRIFVHLNKLSYGIYLLNPIVVALVYGARDHSDHFTPITLVRISKYYTDSEEIKIFSSFIFSRSCLLEYRLLFTC